MNAAFGEVQALADFRDAPFTFTTENIKDLHCPKN